MATSTDTPARKRRRTTDPTDFAADDADDTDATPDTPDTPPADNLIPIRLDLTVDGHRINETFCWSASEQTLTPALFAAQLSSDLGLPATAAPAIADHLSEQLALHVTTSSRPAGGESRHIVRLEVRIGRVVLRDQFEWDLSESSNNPDAFAERLCADVGLRSDHVPAVAHALREQLAELVEFEEKRARGPSLAPADAVRPIGDVERWQPRMECLTAEEKEKLERKEKREARLQRRNRGKADSGARQPRSGARARRGGVRKISEPYSRRR